MRVLLLEDNPDDAELLVFELTRAGFEPEWTLVDDEAGLRTGLAEGTDVVLADYNLPGFGAIHALRVINTLPDPPPVIVVSGALSEDSCVEAVRRGAVDYLLKDRLARLGPAVEHALAQRRLDHARRRAEAQSHEHERRFRAAFDHAPVGMAVTSGDGAVIEANAALLEMTGQGLDDLRGHPLTDVVLAEDRPLITEYIDLLYAGGDGDRRRTPRGEPEAEAGALRGRPARELRLVSRTGKVTWTQYSASLIGECRSDNFVHQIADITARRRAEQALQRQAEQLARSNAELQELDRLKSEFIATVSHELRTPLTSIRGYTEILAEDVDGVFGEEDKRIISIIDRNGRRLLNLIDDLLTFSHIEAGTLVLTYGPVQMADVLDSAVEAVRSTAQPGLTIRLDTADQLPVVEADGAQIERVMLNLLSNSVKFSPDGGTVTVTARAEPTEVVVSVADTGMGIAEAEQVRLFTRFFRSAEAQRRAINGSGLGLAISKSIVEAHGGWIGLSSTPGVGTTVSLGLPVPAAVGAVASNAGDSARR
jgi:signal transduction histidine kinase/CheY-like chemotaxis protein